MREMRGNRGQGRARTGAEQPLAPDPGERGAGEAQAALSCSPVPVKPIVSP